MSNLIVNPFTDITPPVVPETNNSMGGGGENGLKADQSGLWFGSRKFADAPFKVDMEGNVTANSMELIGGKIKYGKTSFADSAHSGYYIGTEGVYFGSASDTAKIKFDISSGVMSMVGAISWDAITGVPESATASYITSTKITATTIEAPL
jgi:hypothetical protein